MLSDRQQASFLSRVLSQPLTSLFDVHSEQGHSIIKDLLELVQGYYSPWLIKSEPTEDSYDALRVAGSYWLSDDADMEAAKQPSAFIVAVQHRLAKDIITYTFVYDAEANQWRFRQQAIDDSLQVETCFIVNDTSLTSMFEAFLSEQDQGPDAGQDLLNAVKLLKQLGHNTSYYHLLKGIQSPREFKQQWPALRIGIAESYYSTYPEAQALLAEHCFVNIEENQSISSMEETLRHLKNSGDFIFHDSNYQHLADVMLQVVAGLCGVTAQNPIKTVRKMIAQSFGIDSDKVDDFVKTNSFASLQVITRLARENDMLKRQQVSSPYEMQRFFAVTNNNDDEGDDKDNLLAIFSYRL